MAKEFFKSFNLNAATTKVVEQANSVIERYVSQGYRLTLRQLYYQFVTQNWITNEERSYKRLAEIVSKGRLAGLIDWDAIEDRGRRPAIPAEFADLEELVQAALHSYRLPRWEDQPYYCELWVEKQALAGVLEPLARSAHITLMVNKGYSSQSAMHESAERFAIRGTGKEKVLLYLGDHDPSGEDMVRDIRDRMEMFGVEVDVQKIALTMDQIEHYKPPPNPAKVTDPRAAAYIAEHGDSSWEVDALEPAILQRLIRDAIAEFLDEEKMAAIKKREELDKAELLVAVKKLTEKRS